MEKLEKIILEDVIKNLKSQVKKLNLFEISFEFIEKFIEQLMIKLAKSLLQELVTDKTNEIGFEEQLKIEIEGKIRILNGNKNLSKISISSLFGEIIMLYKNYYNKTTKSSVKVNCINYNENDKVSPNVKKKIVTLTPFEFYEDSNDKLYNLTGINISTATIKRVTNSISNKNNEWINKKIINQNNQSYKKNIIYQSDRIVLSNDGGRYKTINFESNGRTAKKNPEWKEAKAGIVFEIDENGKKINNTYCYGGFDKKWEDLENNMSYASNRFGIINCKQFETISDNGNGIKQMYERKFNIPDNKIYFDVCDFYHTTEYIWELGKIIFPNKNNIDEASLKCEKWVDDCIDILLKLGGKKLLEFFKLESYDNKILKENYEKYITYFKNNYKRMDYHISKKNNLPIGSGEMEATIKKMINKRFKRNNIYWLTENANNLFRLSCTILNKEFDEFWDNIKNNNDSWFNLKKSA